MDRFRELSTFVAVADAGAFNAAARRLNMSPPAVTRFVTALESRLGIQLFTRTTRQVALTEAGQRFHEDARRILAELEQAEASASGAHEAPSGELRVTAPVLFGQRFIAPLLCAYLDAHPGVTATTLFVDRQVDLINEGYDVALRIAELPDSTLAATRVGAVRRVLVASPDYLAAAEEPMSPQDLSSHRVILPTGADAMPRWDFHAQGKTRSVRLTPALRVNTLQTAIDAATAGWGVTRVLSYQVADELASGSLVEVLREWEDQEMPIHLIHPEGRRAAAKIRTFIDFAATRLRRQAGRLLAE